MTIIKFYGGVNQIGGNKIFIEDSDEKLIFDFGLSFSDKLKYFNDFLNPRTVNGLGDYLNFNLIPNIPGLYRDDLAIPINYPTTIEKKIDAIFISHAHVDHFGLISLIREDIPVYASETTNKIIKSYEDSSPSGIDKEFYNIKKRPYGEYIHHSKWKKETRNFNLWKDFDGVNKIDFFNLDHSIWGAGGYVIETSDKRIVFTGDLRQHGLRGDLTKNSIKNLSNDDIDILIIEGTNVGNENSDIKKILIIEEIMGKSLGKKLESEEDLRKEALKIIQSTKKPVFVDFSIRDFDRFLIFLGIAKECGRNLVIPVKLAKHLHDLKKIINVEITDENIIIYQEPKRLGSYNVKEYSIWEREFYEFENVMKHDEIQENLNNSIVYMDYFHLKNLIDLRPSEGGIYIHSTTEPFDEEQAIDFRRHLRWIKKFGLEYSYLHTSGHMQEKEIFQTIRNLNPKNIIPIHTIGAQIFKKHFPNVIIPKIGSEI